MEEEEQEEEGEEEEEEATNKMQRIPFIDLFKSALYLQILVQYTGRQQ